jgi:hypothetical protein
VALKAALEVPKGLRTGKIPVSDQDHKLLFTFQRLKFKGGPDPPVTPMAPPAEGQEPEPVYEENVALIK